ncbi:MAG: CaiB/BaiF CoA transferase family protein, partial [Thermoanaerobaculia bacterium]
PGEWTKLGFRTSNFGRGNPKLVHASITGYGSGPDADRPAYDVILQAESGLMSLTGFGEGEPVRVGVAVIDFLSALYGLSGVLAALVERGVTGRGRRVEVSMIDAGTAFLSYAAQSWLADGRQPPALGSRHPNLAPYQALPTRDGWFLVGVGSPDQWRRFCQAVGRPDLEADPRFATNADRVRHRAELDALLAGIFRERSSADWDEAMRAHRIPAAAPATVGESVERARARGQLLPLGDLFTLAAPYLFDGERLQPYRTAPALGEHTEEVLREIGFSAPPPRS